MRGKDMLEKMELVDPAYVEAADAAVKKRKSPWAGWAAVACFCLLLSGLAAAALLSGEAVLSPIADGPALQPDGEQPVQSEGPWQPWEAHFNEVSAGAVMDSSRLYAEGYFTEELSEAELAAIEPGMRIGYMEYSGYAGFTSEGELLEVHLEITTSIPELPVSLCISKAAVPRDYDLPGEARISRCEDVEYSVFQWESGENIFLDAKASINGYNFFFSLKSSENMLEQAKEDFTRVLECFAHYAEGKPDLSAVRSERIPEYLNQALTLEEAQSDGDFGAYMLPGPPEGFSPESIRRYKDQNEDSLSGLWTRGYDELRWKVSFFSEADAERLTSPEEKENYDLSLYPIPRAESVPEALRQIVDNPIFLAEELCLDAVLARAYVVDDAGDSDGWRMDFSVKYGNILVEVRAKGLAPVWVYQQLMELAAQ